MTPIGKMACILIGRNEGERLRAACASFGGLDLACRVYVDSNSTDDSVSVAAAAGFHIVRLDMSIPFSAARARNEGARLAAEIAPEHTHILFMDGDCRVAADWPATALKALEADPNLAVVCGRRREIAPHASVYNALIDREWDTPVGRALACGGDSIMRRDAFDEAGGFRPDVIAGEEPELCYRLRQAGWHIERLDADMSHHDAALSRFSQWWQRMRRSGYAFTLGMILHGKGPERFNVRATLRILAWSLFGPFMLAAALLVDPWIALGLGLYPLQFARLAIRSDRRPPGRLATAWFTLLGQFAECTGVIACLRDTLTRADRKIIEYKGKGSAS